MVSFAGIRESIVGLFSSDKSESAQKAEAKNVAEGQKTAEALQSGLTGGKKNEPVKGEITMFSDKAMTNQGELREIKGSWAWHNFTNGAKEIASKIGKDILGVIGLALLPLGVLQSCSPDNSIHHEPDMGITAGIDVSQKDFVEHTVDALNDNKDVNGECRSDNITADGIEYEFGMDDVGNGNAKGWVQIGEGPSNKFYLDGNKEVPVTAQNVLDYIEHDVKDQKPSIGTDYEFGLTKDGDAKVTLENGLEHTIGESYTLKAGGAMDKLLGAFTSALPRFFPQNSPSELMLGVKSGRGSYTNEGNQPAHDNEGFSLKLVSKDLGEITQGNPKVEGNIMDVKFSGTVVAQNDGTVQIKDGNKVVTLNPGEHFVDGEMSKGILVTVKDGASERTFFMGDFENPGIEIAEIKPGDDEPEFQYYVINSRDDFNTKDIGKIDDFYYEKEGNLEDAVRTADCRYDEVMNGFVADAEAEVKITY